MDELKPCPFCGGEAIGITYIRDGWRATCGCGAAAKSCFHGPADMPSAEQRAVTAWNTRPSVTDEMVEVRIGILGCDDSTYLTRQMTKEQFTFLEEVAEQISEQSTYGCMPVMNAALTAALGGPHG